MKNLSSMVVITGGSGSGKSEFAEQVSKGLAGSSPLFYLATMQPFGEEGAKRILRHRRLREGKGFTTVECFRQVHLADAFQECDDKTVLLECMSNLLANEIYAFPGERKTDPVADIVEQIKKLRGVCRHLVVVTNEVSSDGNAYDEETRRYIGCLGRINEALGELADEVYEVVYGIPLCLRREPLSARNRKAWVQP